MTIALLSRNQTTRNVRWEAPSVSFEPSVNIIINNYNYGRFLQAAIDSALRQSYHNYKVIVVDDGSTDNSREIISTYGDRIISIFKQNGGQASALNAGFARSSAEVVIFLDADDILLPETLQQVVDAFRANPHLAKVQYRMEVIDGAGHRTGTIQPHPHLPMPNGDVRQRVLMFPYDITWMATSGNAFAAWSLGQIFPIPEQEFRILADFYVSHLTPLFGPVVSLDRVGAYYRVHGGNNYAGSTIDLRQIRQTITHWRNTNRYIKKFAYLLGLTNHVSDVSDASSVAYLANRVISLKLDPEQHPIKEDRIWRLFVSGIIASFRRFDVSLVMKCLFLLWFSAMLVAPKSVAHWLAMKFLFPETRGSLNNLLGMFHHAR